MRETNLLISCRFCQQLSGLNLLKFNPGKAGRKQPQKQQQGDEKTKWNTSSTRANSPTKAMRTNWF